MAVVRCRKDNPRYVVSVITSLTNVQEAFSLNPSGDKVSDAYKSILLPVYMLSDVVLLISSSQLTWLILRSRSGKYSHVQTLKLEL